MLAHALRVVPAASFITQWGCCVQNYCADLQAQCPLLVGPTTENSDINMKNI